MNLQVSLISNYLNILIFYLDLYYFLSLSYLRLIILYFLTLLYLFTLFSKIGYFRRFLSKFNYYFAHISNCIKDLFGFNLFLVLKDLLIHLELILCILFNFIDIQVLFGIFLFKFIDVIKECILNYNFRVESFIV